MLDRLDAAVVPEDMDLPGLKFHELKGRRKGVYSVAVSGNWRMTFKFDGDSAIEVDLEDYH
jgi:proteic killer suppression protein